MRNLHTRQKVTSYIFPDWALHMIIIFIFDVGFIENLIDLIQLIKGKID